MPTRSENGKVTALQLLSSKKHHFLSLRPCNLANCTRGEIRNYFENSYDLDEGIFSAITDEQYFYKCPDRLRLPLIFYFAHTSTLYVNKLLLSGLIKERVNRHFETLFETGVDEMSWDDIENYRMGGTYKWPRLQEVMEYRQTVRDMVIHVIETAPLKLPINQEHPWWSLFMAMEHQRIHLETSSVLIRQLPVQFLKTPVNWKYAPLTSDTPIGPNEFIQVPEGDVTLGKPNDFPTYGWDNEYGTRTMKVPAFEATKYLTTNREFQEFVAAGGYQRRELWTDEGWQWVQYRQAKHPIFWVCHEGCKSNGGSDLASYSHCTLPYTNETSADYYRYRAMYDVIDMPWEWPVDVNYHEAKAYCQWKGPDFRLPTEAEHHRMAGEQPPSSKFDSDPICVDNDDFNINFQYGSSTPVNFFPPNSLGFYDVYGNVWKWMEDHFNGLPGFNTHYLYDDFSSPCFDGRHTMMQGGSWISTGDEASRFARFAFRRHFYQHMGFRVVRSLTSETTPVKLCDLNVYVHGAGVIANPITVPGVIPKECYEPSTNNQFRYDEQQMCEKLITLSMGKDVDYGQPLVIYCNQLVTKLKLNTSDALVIGCGPGYSSFLLAKTFDNVIGIDYSGRLVDSALEFQSKGKLSLKNKELLYLPLSEDIISKNNVTFKQLTWIPNELKDFNLILFEFLDRLMEPKGWLLKMWECLSENGLLVISASEKWTANILSEYLGQWFECIEETTVGDKAVSSWQLKCF